jgi:signal transduction histidine kinase
VTSPRTHGPADLERELERRTRELAESEARFRDIIERNADAIVVVDRDGVVRFANAMAVKLFGRRRAELVGTPFGFPAIAGETTEVDLIAGGSARVAEMRVVESLWDGGPAYIASLRDVTERKQAEENARRLIREQAARAAVSEVARRQRFLLDLSAALSASLDYESTLAALASSCAAAIADWVAVYCVAPSGEPRHLEIAHRDPAKADLARALRGVLTEGEGPHPVIELFEAGKPRLIGQVDESTLRSLGRNASEEALARQLGVESLMLVPMVARGRPLGAIAFVSGTPGHRFEQDDLALAEDIGARAALALDNARLYGEAQRANDTRANLLAVVSHDLRTPLNAIMGYADLMAEGIPDQLPEGSRKQLERIRRSSRHLLYLMNELLAFTRLDAGRDHVHLQEVDLNEIGADVAAVIEPLAGERGLRLTVELPGRPLRMRTDPDKLRQVLLNVAGNAVKYTKQGEVHLRIGQETGRVVISVRDTGAGIRPEDLAHIFDPFWQAPSTQRSNEGGAGLGLSIVRRLVDLLGGTAAVESTLGRGTTFTVSLPGQ